MTRHPRLSIGMPVYNGAPFIEEAINSLLTQSFEDFELIISDNASTDRTEAICRAYMEKDSRVRYYRNNINLGAARNYNHVFELSTGDYFKWAAADDMCAPIFLKECIKVLDPHPQIILCYAKTNIIDENGRILMPYDDELDLSSSTVSTRFSKALRTIRECNAVFGVIRSGVLKETSLIGNYIGSDIVLLTQLSLYGQSYQIPDRLFFRRVHPGAYSCNKSLESQQIFFDPRTKGKISMYFWRHLVQHFVSIMRAPLKPTEKVRLTYLLLRHGVSCRSRLLQESLDALMHVVRTHENLKHT